MEIKKSNIIPTLIVMGWFGILLIVATMMTGCEKHDDCKTYRCGDREVISMMNVNVLKNFNN